MTHLIKPDRELELLNTLIFQPCEMALSNIIPDPESKEYSGCTFKLGDQSIIFRVAKITPTKVGQFVTIWKRNENGITEPFNVSDNFNSYIIVTRTEKNFGLFIFPKAVLREQKVISDGISEGKRGTRVYPPWDITTNKQAQQTQRWQTNYFIHLSEKTPTDFEKARKLLR